ncbi:hypothetical protein WR25_23939 isoform C [Diploscapter pachys]|uniref:JmjC domain-containing protein n=1 Tax=Diploscapter pachys TaxID=2018661 RepID=A0A2A2J9D9_9BILA|nr:hypothetical protein WR25_23939 isoform C [Diploscapter pachys]
MKYQIWLLYHTVFFTSLVFGLDQCLNRDEECGSVDEQRQNENVIDHGGWRTNRQNVVGLEGPCNIPRLDAQHLSQGEFLKKYAYAEPIIIYNIDNSEFARLTERQKMLEDWREERVVLSSANTYSYTRVPSTFGDYLETHLRPQSLESLGNETLYLFGDIDPTTWKPLLDKYRQPQYKLPGHTAALSFGLAGAGTGVPFHFHGPGFAEVVHGSKRWFLYEPDREINFNPDKSTLEWLEKYFFSKFKNMPILGTYTNTPNCPKKRSPANAF